MTDSLAVSCLVLVLLWISVEDLRAREIPDSGSLLVALSGGVLWSDDPKALTFNVIWGALIVLALGFAGEQAWRRTGREWLGLGDAKLIGAGTIVVGWAALWVMLLVASVGAICAALIVRWREGDEGVPFGPFLAYAIFVTHMIAGPSP